MISSCLDLVLVAQWGAYFLPGVGAVMSLLQVGYVVASLGSWANLVVAKNRSRVLTGELLVRLALRVQ